MIKDINLGTATQNFLSSFDSRILGTGALMKFVFDGRRVGLSAAFGKLSQLGIAIPAPYTNTGIWY
jgi:hypothetical protein